MAGDHGDIRGNEILTHVGKIEERVRNWHELKFSFRTRLRPQLGETYMSVLRGEIDAAMAVPLIARGDAAGSADATRYARADAFRKAGFTVTPMPTRSIAQHVAVFADGEWTDETAVRFAKCFHHYTPGPSQ